MPGIRLSLVAGATVSLSHIGALVATYSQSEDFYLVFKKVVYIVLKVRSIKKVNCDYSLPFHSSPNKTIVLYLVMHNSGIKRLLVH